MTSFTLLKKQTLTGTKSSNQPFAELYRLHVDQVYGYLLAHTGNVHDAQDLTAQTFVAALEGMHSYRADGSFAAWVLGIARRKVVDYYRARKNIVSLDDADTLTHPTTPLEEAISQQLQLEHVTLALHTLTPERVEALTLYIFGSLSIQETASVMGKSEGAVKMLIHRALHDLRQKLNEEGE